MRLRTISVLAGLAAATGAAITAGASAASPDRGRQAPIVLARSGGFQIGGKVIQNPGDASQHLSCDHGYVEYFLPQRARRTSLVMWHSSSTQVWQNRWDGGEGYKDMFLRRDYPVYLWDGPRVGRANWSCEAGTYTPRYGDEANFTAWNLGRSYKNWWPHEQFPIANEDAWRQATSARYVEYNTLKAIELETDAAVVAADSGKLGDSIVYLTNSAGGLRAMVTATKATKGNIAGIVAYEGVGYVFPIGDPESPPSCTNLDACPFGPVGVPLEAFKKLAKLRSIQFVWGDNRSDPTEYMYKYVAWSQLCAKLINKYGGHAEVLMLGPDAGLIGSTHIPFADMDNDKVAGLLDAFLKKAGLDSYRRAKPNGHWVWSD
jgi:hypothetical protein